MAVPVKQCIWMMEDYSRCAEDDALHGTPDDDGGGGWYEGGDSSNDTADAAAGMGDAMGDAAAARGRSGAPLGRREGGRRTPDGAREQRLAHVLQDFGVPLQRGRDGLAELQEADRPD